MLLQGTSKPLSQSWLSDSDLHNFRSQKKSNHFKLLDERYIRVMQVANIWSLSDSDESLHKGYVFLSIVRWALKFYKIKVI